MHPLDPYVQAWRGSARDVLDLLPTLSDQDWSQPTDCPDWSVHDVAAHLAHLEAVLAGHDTNHRPGDGNVVATDFTQAGVEDRADRTPEELIEEFRAAVDSRIEALDPLPDPGAMPDVSVSPRWTWEVLLRNRVVDVWVHEQDIRRAVNRPGSLGSDGAKVTTYTLAAGMPFVLGKRVAPPVGTSVVWTLTGELPMEFGAVIGADGRAASDVGDAPTSRLTMTSDAFTTLAAGRRTPDQVDLEISGDRGLASSVLAAMSVVT